LELKTLRLFERGKTRTDSDLVDLAKLYSELIGRGYIKEIEREVCFREHIEEPYVVTGAGVDRERYLAKRHAVATRKTRTEVADDYRNTVHLAYLGALTLHDWSCSGCA